MLGGSGLSAACWLLSCLDCGLGVRNSHFCLTGGPSDSDLALGMVWTGICPTS